MSGAVIPFRPRELLLKQGRGARVFHKKFGMGTVRTVDSNKLTIDFDAFGPRVVIDSFVRGWAGTR